MKRFLTDVALLSPLILLWLSALFSNMWAGSPYLFHFQVLPIYFLALLAVYALGSISLSLFNLSK